MDKYVCVGVHACDWLLLEARCLGYLAGDKIIGVHELYGVGAENLVLHSLQE